MLVRDVRCPACSKMGNIELSEEKTKNVTRGLLAVNVPINAICEHSFIAYIDKNLQVRDCFIADFTIELPDAIPEQKAKQKIEPEREQFDLDLIKMNFSALLIVYVLRGCFFKRNIVIVNDKKFLDNHLKNFFNKITQNSFDLYLSIISNEEYRINKKVYKKDLIFEDKEIINDKDKIINRKKLNIERTFVQRFYSEMDPTESLIGIKNEINKAYELSKRIVEFINNIDKKEKLISKTIIDMLQEEYNIKVQIPYLKFLLDIVENYFEAEIPKISDVSNFLGFL